MQSNENDTVTISDDESEPLCNSTFLSARSAPIEIGSSSSEGPTILSDDEVEDSFDERSRTSGPILQQKTLDSYLNRVKDQLENVPKNESNNNVIKCKRTEFNDQVVNIKQAEKEMTQMKYYMNSVKLANLPDKGENLKQKFEQAKKKFLHAQERLKNMVVVEEDEEKSGKATVYDNWAALEAGFATVQPKTFGKKGLATHTAEKALTFDRLEQLHGSLKNCPQEDNTVDDPKGLKVPLMAHQKRALAWMLYRETQKPAGGILADDMGLGKTLTMLSLIVQQNKNRDEENDTEDEEDEEKRHKKYKGATLVICPLSLLQQWTNETETKLKRGLLSFHVFYGPNRESRAKRLIDYDLVITTRSTVMHEHEKKSTLFKIRWNRVIIDEAHEIRNHKTKSSVACCELSAKYRWALTGTPVHNKELDMFGLLRFLKCSPFDDLAVWKRWVSDKSSGGGERLHTVISSLMLRRTKVELIEKGELAAMTERHWELVTVQLDKEEMSVYQKILIFSQTLFAQYLHQRAEKNQEIADFSNPDAEANAEYFKVRQRLLKLNKIRDVSQHEILVLLLRLRQICCHPSLITGMLHGDEDLEDDERDGENDHLDLLDQLNKLTLDDDHAESEDNSATPSAEGFGLKEATKNILNPSHPVFDRERMSSKLKTVIKMIEKIGTTGEKIIIVSQWRSYLELVGIQLKKIGIKFMTLDGTVPTAKRAEVVQRINDRKDKIKVLLLSLTAGGVGLNLVGANHLFLLDLHWNPQLENQAQDRIYRMGQEKNVHVYKFMVSGTIEERIKTLQENKLQTAENLLTGSKQVVGNKLSLQDLRMLFAI